jgi:hypothetical protein
MSKLGVVERLKAQFDVMSKKLDLILEMNEKLTKTYCQGCESVEVDPEMDYENLCKSCR